MNGLERANFNALAAGRALVAGIHHFAVVILALRVVTPETGKTAALEKYRRAYSVAIVYRIALDIYYVRKFHKVLLYRF